MGRNAARRGGARFDLVQRAGQQAAFRQQGVDGRDSDREGCSARSLDTMSAFQPSDLLAQDRRDLPLRLTGSRGSKGVWGNDGHRPLGSFPMVEDN